LGFTTGSAPQPPTDVLAYTDGATVAISFTRGVATEGTLLRYKLGGYPSSTSDGTLISATPYGSASFDGDYGTTYYVALWGYAGSNYTDAAYVMITTGAGETPGGGTAPSEPGSWFLTPDYTRMSNMPLYSQFNDFYDSISLPRVVGWFLGALLISVAIGLLVLVKSKRGSVAVIAIAAMLLVMTLLRLMPGFTVIISVLFFLGASKMTAPARGGMSG